MLVSTKPPKCRHCGKRTDALKQLLHSDCIEPWLANHRKKQALKERKEQIAKAKVERAKTKARRRELETIPGLKAETQRWFNKFVRLRDRDKGCYVCLKPFPVGRLGGDFDAGHVLSRGSADHLRFCEDNCFGECKSCNSSWGATQEQKQAGAIRRIGAERWAAVRSDSSITKWNRDSLREQIAHYKALCKELERQQA